MEQGQDEEAIRVSKRIRELKANAQQSKSESPKQDFRILEKPTEGKKLEEVKEESPKNIEKPKLIKPLFGYNQSSTEQIKQSKSIDHNSPAFGESKSAAKPEGINSLFKPKNDPIPESDKENESEDKNIEENPKPKPVNLFGRDKSKVASEPATLNPTAKISPFTQKDATEAKPLNLFAKEKRDSQPVPTKVLFSGALATKDPEQKVNIFSAKKTPGGIFGAKTQSTSLSQPAQSTSELEKKEPSGEEDEDVGMGGVTPPKANPIQKQNPIAANYQMQRNQVTAPMHSQGSGESKSSGIFGVSGASGTTSSGIFSEKPKTSSIFGSTTEPKTAGSAPVKFTMGLPTQQISQSAIFGGIPKTSRGLFATEPNQGQPELNKTSSWSQNPFGNKLGKKKEKDDDGLFSEK